MHKIASYLADLYYGIGFEFLTTAIPVSITAVIVIFILHKKGYLKSKIINGILLILALSYFAISSFFLSKSQKDMKSFYIQKNNREELTKISKQYKTPTFGYTEEEVNVLLDLKKARNSFLSYSNSIKEEYSKFEPFENKYGYILVEAKCLELSKKELETELWEELLNEFFHYNTKNNHYIYTNYKFIQSIKSIKKGDETSFFNYAGFINNYDDAKSVAISEFICRNIYTVDRTTEAIETFWNDNKLYLFTFFTKDRYNEICKDLIDDLIAINIKIKEQPNYREFYQKYDVSDPEFGTFPSEAYIDSYKSIWGFGFWDRRFQEQNDEIIFNILKEIQNHYK